MKSTAKNLIAAAATTMLATFGSAALAQTTVVPGEIGFVFADAPSVRTRAEVNADLFAAKASGEYARLNSTRPTFAFEQSVKSRAEVRADVLEAAQAGELIHNDGEVYFQRNG